MRRILVLLVALAALGRAGEDQSRLETLVEKFASASVLERDAASREARKEVARLLQPLLKALESADPEVRRRAKAAMAMELPAVVDPKRVPRWHAMKAAGPPDAKANQDHPNAWASKRGNMGPQWLELTYRKPMKVKMIRIYEVNRAGAVAQVMAFDKKGKAHVVWKGVDPTRKPGVFDLKIQPTPFKVVRLRVVLDTNRVSGWNEIDAVEIVGPKGRQWAIKAHASSSYADRG
jgi:hypothetical protein